MNNHYCGETMMTVCAVQLRIFGRQLICEGDPFVGRAFLSSFMV